MKAALKSARDYVRRILGLIAPAFLAHVASDPKRTGWPPMPQPSIQDKEEMSPRWHPHGPPDKWRKSWKSK